MSDKARAKRLWDSFRITPEEWERIYAYQSGVCFICGLTQDKRPATDHSHETGEVRGLLCSRCNPLLGKLENAFKRYGLHKLEGITLLGILKRTLVYLENPPATAALGRTVIGYPGRVGTDAHRKWIRNSVPPEDRPKKKRKPRKKHTVPVAN